MLAISRGNPQLREGTEELAAAPRLAPHSDLRPVWGSVHARGSSLAASEKLGLSVAIFWRHHMLRCGLTLFYCKQPSSKLTQQAWLWAALHLRAAGCSGTLTAPYEGFCLLLPIWEHMQFSARGFWTWTRSNNQWKEVSDSKNYACSLGLWDNKDSTLSEQLISDISCSINEKHHPLRSKKCNAAWKCEVILANTEQDTHCSM